MQTLEAVSRKPVQESESDLSVIRPFFSKHRNSAFIKLDSQKWVRIDFRDVVYIEAREKISLIFFSDGQHIICRSPLYKVQCVLPPGFERVHRAFIVNVNWVEFVDVARKEVKLKNDASVALGLAYKDSITKYFVNPNKSIMD